jgi:hypothetical protein
VAAVPALAAAVAAVFAGRCALAARRRGRAALAVWALALAQFSVASAALAWGVAGGWSPAAFRVYYLFGAVLNVAWLGLGTVWLLAPRAASGAATAALLVASGWAAQVVGRASLQRAVLATHEVVSGAVFPETVRNLSRGFSFAGLVALLGGLGYSLAARRPKAAGLGLLFAGVVLAFVGSELGRHGSPVPFSAGLAAGVVVMYAGFVRTM